MIVEEYGTLLLKADGGLSPRSRLTLENKGDADGVLDKSTTDQVTKGVSGKHRSV